MDILLSVNWTGAILAGIASMIIGGIWYAPFALGKAWMKASGFDEDNAAHPAKAMASSLLANIIFAMLLSVLMNVTGGADAGIGVAAHYGLFMAMMVAAGTWQNYAFENKSLLHFLIHTGNQVISMMVMAIVLVLV